MRHKTPKLALLMRRLLDAVKDVRQAIQKKTEATQAGNKGNEVADDTLTEVRAEIRYDLQTAEDAKCEQARSYRTQNSIRKATWAAFFAASIYAGIAAYQAHEMRKATAATEKAAEAASQSAAIATRSFDDSEKFFVIQNRPYMTVSKLDQLNPPQFGESSVSIGIHNSGRTPALKVKIFARVLIGRKELILSPGRPSESVVASDKEVINTYTLSLTENDAKLVASGTDFIFKGTIQYTDVFNQQHTTTFCGRYFPKENNYKFCETGTDVE